MDSGEFRRLDLDYLTRLVLAPLVLMVVWRHSFDFCGGSRLDPDRYLDFHIELLLNGLRAKSAPEAASANDPKG
jgi:hypothetical protein